MTIVTNSEEHYRDHPHVQTSSGLYFTLEDPEFRLHDIAHSLSMLCRFNGHTDRFYSVAEHSMFVGALMELDGAEQIKEGLLHDATEAYLSDVPSPFKQFLPDWKRFDDRLDADLRLHYGLPSSKTEECKTADWLALFIEAYLFLPDRGEGFQDPHGLRDRAVALVKGGVTPLVMPPERAYERFLEAADILGVTD